MNSSHQSQSLSAAEADLGRTLAVLHRVIPRLDDPARAAEVQSALRGLAALIESARAAHETEMTGRDALVRQHRVATAVTPEIAAVIAAAVSVVFEGPYRLLSVRPATAPVPHINVWALEGRTQIFQSHKIR